MRPLTRLTAIAAGTSALAVLALAAPTTHTATPAMASPAFASPVIASDAMVAPTISFAAENDGVCDVSSAEMSWGVKESFRSYISSTIANGGWEVSEGATYETPLFSWHEGSGHIDPATGEGEIHFEGVAHFSGHDGVLNLVFSNPTIELRGDGSANLRLDAKSNNAEGELVVDEQQISVGRIDDIGEIDTGSASASIADAPVILTADGAGAFADFYATGSDLDPVSFSFEMSGCDGASGDDGAAADGATEDGAAADGENDAAAENGDGGLNFEIWPIIIIAGLAFLIAFGYMFFTAGRSNVPQQKGGRKRSSRKR